MRNPQCLQGLAHLFEKIVGKSFACMRNSCYTIVCQKDNVHMAKKIKLIYVEPEKLAYMRRPAWSASTESSARGYRDGQENLERLRWCFSRAVAALKLVKEVDPEQLPSLSVFIKSRNHHEAICKTQEQYKNRKHRPGSGKKVNIPTRSLTSRQKRRTKPHSIG